MSRTPCRLEGAVPVEFHGGIERSLPSHGGQNCVRFLPVNDRFDDLGRDRLYIGTIGELRIRHDGGRVGIDQDHLVTLFPQSFAGLDTGVIEFTTLPDHDGTGANE